MYTYKSRFVSGHQRATTRGHQRATTRPSEGDHKGSPLLWTNEPGKRSLWSLSEGCTPHFHQNGHLPTKLAWGWKCLVAIASTSGQQRCKEVSAVSMAERKGLIFPFLQSQLAALQINPPPKNHSCSRLSIKKREM